MNDQINVLLEVLEEIKQQNRELKANISNLPQPTESQGEIKNRKNLAGITKILEEQLEFHRRFREELCQVVISLEYGSFQVICAHFTPKEAGSFAQDVSQSLQLRADAEQDGGGAEGSLCGRSRPLRPEVSRESFPILGGALHGRHPGTAPDADAALHHEQIGRAHV